MAQNYRVNEMPSEEFHGRVLNQRHEPGEYIAKVTLSVLVMKLLLEHKHGNRPFKGRTMRHVRQALTAKPSRWKVNGESIKLSDEGRLLDGQNRCLVASELGIPLPTFVVWGLPIESYKTMDLGTKRSGGDMLEIEGVSDPHNMAAALRFYWLIINKKLLEGTAELPSDDIVEYYYKNTTMAYSLGQGRKVRRFLPPAVGSALHYAFRQRPPMKDARHNQDADTLADVMMQELAKGEKLTSRDPTYQWREMLLQRRDDTTPSVMRDKHKHIELAAQGIHVWNALRLRRGITTGGIRWDLSMPFPEIL